MAKFMEYLQKAKSLADNINLCNKKSVHIIIGNESCDLDSMVSALSLGFSYYKKSVDTLVIPVLNIHSQDLALRMENCYVLKKLDIDSNCLVCRNNINLKAIQNVGLMSVSLVDHHVLQSSDQFLMQSVTEIFDHRPIDPNAKWNKNKTKVVIEQVGSCATLIANVILNTDDQILNIAVASLLYWTIIFDTIALNLNVGKTKELDIMVINKLVKQFSFSQDFQSIFNELWSAHNDVSHLNTLQLLSKDLKTVEGLPIPVLPMLFEEYITLPYALENMATFCKERCSSIMVVIGLKVKEDRQQVYRDIAIFTCDNDNLMMDAVIYNLSHAAELKGYDFDLEEISINYAGVRYFKQRNIKLTRKHIVPLIREAVLNPTKGQDTQNKR